MAQADQPGNAGATGSGAPSVAVEAAGGYLLAGLLLFGGIGVALDRWLGLTAMTPIGIVVGGLLGGYLIYLRFVSTPQHADETDGRTVGETADTTVQNGRGSGVAEGDSR